MSRTDYRVEARALAGAGVSVIPVKSDGSKLPGIRWKEFQKRIMTDEEIEQHFTNCGGVIAVTGNVSNLICIDFDLDKQTSEDDYWKAFMDEVPDSMKERMLINRTRSGGFHVWLRTTYEDKSRKVTHRPLTIPEIVSRYETMIKDGANKETASMMLLKKPVECVIETRSRGSYAVFVHEQYSRFFGTGLSSFTNDEVEFLLNIGYSLDFNFRKPKVYKGKESDYKIISKFNEDATAKGICSIIEGSGMYTFYDIDPNGNYRMARVGSSSTFSAYIYADTGVTHIFGMNPFTDDDKVSISPFEIFCSVNNFTEEEAIEQVKGHYED